MLNRKKNKKMDNMKKEKSCGCVVIKDKKILVIYQIDGFWGFPKGHVEENETELQTAIREVKEETNLDVKVDERKRYIIEYLTEEGSEKQVIYFVAKVIGGEIKPQEIEIKEIAWLDFEDAINIVTYDNTKEMLRNILWDLFQYKFED